MNTGYIPPKRPPGAADLSPITAPELLQATARHMADRAATYDAAGGERSMARTVVAFNALTEQAARQEKIVTEAARHHADVLAWLEIADALSPDGIPGEMLAEALGPMNARLGASAVAAGWSITQITAGMDITGDGRPYALLSESEKWRADAMIAEAVSYLSGLRLLVLDRFDVLDLTGRADALEWLDALAEADEIDTALVFGTLKALPGGLPDSMQAHWIDGGVVVQMREAA